jgi:hypothetical protein
VRLKVLGVAHFFVITLAEGKENLPYVNDGTVDIKARVLFCGGRMDSFRS